LKLKKWLVLAAFLSVVNLVYLLHGYNGSKQKEAAGRITIESACPKQLVIDEVHPKGLHFKMILKNASNEAHNIFLNSKSCSCIDLLQGNEKWGVGKSIRIVPGQEIPLTAIQRWSGSVGISSIDLLFGINSINTEFLRCNESIEVVDRLQVSPHRLLIYKSQLKSVPAAAGEFIVKYCPMEQEDVRSVVLSASKLPLGIEVSSVAQDEGVLEGCQNAKNVQWDVELSFTGDSISWGDVDTIKMFCTTPGSSHAHEVQLPVHLRDDEGIACPRELGMGVVKIGESISKKLLVRSNSQHRFSIEQAFTDNDSFTVSYDKNVVSDFHFVRVKFEPSITGKASANLTIKSNVDYECGSSLSGIGE